MEALLFNSVGVTSRPNPNTLQMLFLPWWMIFMVVECMLYSWDRKKSYCNHGYIKHVLTLLVETNITVCSTVTVLYCWSSMNLNVIMPTYVVQLEINGNFSLILTFELINNIHFHSNHWTEKYFMWTCN